MAFRGLEVLFAKLVVNLMPPCFIESFFSGAWSEGVTIRIPNAVEF